MVKFYQPKKNTLSNRYEDSIVPRLVHIRIQIDSSNSCFHNSRIKNEQL